MDNEITINGEIYVRKAEIGNPISEEKPWPQEGDEYFYVTSYGEIIYETFGATINDYKRKNIGNFFQTREEAEMYSLRIESLGKGFIPSPIGKFWVWDFVNNKPWDSESLETYYIPPKFPTKEECQEWGEKYSGAWLYLYNQ